MKVLVTGGAGFIGSAVVRQYICRTEATVINLDKLTYAASLDSVAEAAASARYQFVKADICDATAVAEIFARYRPDAVLHLAAESHVDRSIDGPGAFIATNVIGTYVLLEAARKHWDGLRGEAKAVQKAEKLLSEHGLTIDAVMANAFVRHIRGLESIERMVATAEIRRDRILNEIEKRRDAIAWRLREAASNVIDVEGDPAPVAATS